MTHASSIMRTKPVSPFTPALFATHQGVNAQPAASCVVTNKAVIDLAGSAALPFLQQFVQADLNTLKVQGMGLYCQGQINAQAISLELYYFSETAFRLVYPTAIEDVLLNYIAEHESHSDIAAIKRDDLTILAVFGDNAFNTILTEFKLTPGIILQNQAQRYGKQSNGVFLTATHLESHQGYELIAKGEQIAALASKFAAHGFNNKHAA
jgi:glycine cleavage system aminomethyltransferase T